MIPTMKLQTLIELKSMPDFLDKDKLVDQIDQRIADLTAPKIVSFQAPPVVPPIALGLAVR